MKNFIEALISTAYFQPLRALLFEAFCFAIKKKLVTIWSILVGQLNDLFMPFKGLTKIIILFFTKKIWFAIDFPKTDPNF